MLNRANWKPNYLNPQAYIIGLGSFIHFYIIQITTNKTFSFFSFLGLDLIRKTDFVTHEGRKGVMATSLPLCLLLNLNFSLKKLKFIWFIVPMTLDL